jgi:hypothetical protein
MRTTTLSALAAAAAVSSSALAGLVSGVNVGPAGGVDVLRPYDFSSSVFGNAATGNFTTAALASVHSVLNTAGVATANWITVIAGHVDTNNDQVADETALFWLVDNQVAAGGASPDSSISFQSGINKTSGTAAWINDVGDAITVDNSAPGFDKIAYGSFNWDNGGFGDAFAWSGLGVGDTGNFFFLNPSWSGFNGIQFVSYDSASNSWSVLEQFTGSGALQQFSFTVIPLPPAAWAGLLGLAAAGTWRRRMIAR